MNVFSRRLLLSTTVCLRLLSTTVSDRAFQIFSETPINTLSSASSWLFIFPDFQRRSNTRKCSKYYTQMSVENRKTQKFPMFRDCLVQFLVHYTVLSLGTVQFSVLYLRQSTLQEETLQYLQAIVILQMFHLVLYFRNTLQY
jgi:hypothetical protein